MNTVTVIGAGPTGLITARKLAETGWQIAVLEEHKSIGKPVNCAGLISKAGVEINKLNVKDCIVNEVHGAKIFSPNGTMLELNKFETVALVIDREKFDKNCLQDALKVGVEVRSEARMLNVKGETIFLQQKKRGEMIKSKIIVGADGVNSNVRQLMQLHVPQNNFANACQFRVKGSFEKKFVQLHFGSFAKNFFAWVIPESKEVARIGLGTTLQENARKNLQEFIQKHDSRVQVLEESNALIPIGEPLKGIVKENLLLVGDAAFHTKATSVDFEEPIVMLDEEGFVRNEKIGELASKEFTNPKNEVITSDNYEIAIPERNIQAFSPNKNAENNGFKTIKTILRHNIDEDLYEIILEKGYRVKATASHSVMTATKKGFIAKDVKKLEKGKDILALNANIPKGRIIKEINLVKEFIKKCPSFYGKLIVRGAREKLFKNYKEVEKNNVSQYWYCNAIPLTKFLEKGIIPANVKLSMHNGRLHFNESIPITAELCRLLGYFAAEGSYKRNNLTLTFGIKDLKEGIAQDTFNCIKKALGIKPEKTFYKKNPQTRKTSSLSFAFGGEIAKMLFLKVLECGHKASGKQVPWIIFNAEDELKMEFLKGYLRGDGSIRMRDSATSRHSSFELSAKTVSKKMASDLVLLSLQLGLFPSVEEFKERKEYTIVGKQANCKAGFKISYSRKEDALKLINVFPGQKHKVKVFFECRREKHTNKIPKELIQGKKIKFEKELRREFGPSIYSSYKNLGAQRLQQVLMKAKTQEHEFIKNILEEKIILLRVKEIKKVAPTGNYVFDVEIPSTQMFSGGIGPILLHNTGGGLVTGAMAASILAETISNNLRHKKPLTEFEKNLSHLNKELHLHWKIRKYLNSMSDAQLNELFAKLKKARVERFLEKHGNMDLPSLFIGRFFRQPRVWSLMGEAMKIIMS